MKVISKTESRIVIKDYIGIPWFVGFGTIFLSGLATFAYKLLSGQLNNSNWPLWSLWIALPLVVVFFVEITETLEADKTSGMLKARVKRLIYTKERSCEIANIEHIGLGLTSAATRRAGTLMYTRPEARIKNGSIFVILTAYHGAVRYNPLYTPLREVKFSQASLAGWPQIQELANFLDVPFTPAQIY